MELSASRLAQIRQLMDEIGDTGRDEAELHQAFELSARSDHESLPPFEPDELERLLQAVFAARDLLKAYDSREEGGADESLLEHVIEPALQEELWQHAGRWAAITRSEILAIGDTPAEVYEAAVALGHKTPWLWYVPKPGVSFY